VVLDAHELLEGEGPWTHYVSLYEEVIEVVLIDLEIECKYTLVGEVDVFIIVS
jgi:hypothetical protein